MLGSLTYANPVVQDVALSYLPTLLIYISAGLQFPMRPREYAARRHVEIYDALQKSILAQPALHWPAVLLRAYVCARSGPRPLVNGPTGHRTRGNPDS